MGILDSIKDLFSGGTEKVICSKCGKLIIKSKSTIVLEAKEYGYCPMCKKLYYKKCAFVTTLADDGGPLECVTCNIKLKGNI